jgi:hypothetical protein
MHTYLSATKCFIICLEKKHFVQNAQEGKADVYLVRYFIRKYNVDEYTSIIKRVSWFKSSLLLRIQSDSFTNINS